MTSRNDFSGIQSILEVPLLNDKFLDKARESDTDAIMLDLEDSAPADRKAEARTKLGAILARPGAFGHRKVFVRINNLATEWAQADLAALAPLGPDVTVCYPKVETRQELDELTKLIRTAEPRRSIYAMIETARGALELDEIARVDGLVGLHCGYVDYATETGCQLFSDTGDDLHPAMFYLRAKIVAAATANRLFSSGGSMVPALRDAAKVESFVRSWKAFGYSCCMALSPAHLEIVNRVFRTSPEMLARAQRVCNAFEIAIAKGELNVILDEKLVTLPDYRNAQQLLIRAGAVA